MIDLTNFADGAVAERFNLELKKVLENIADPNTDPKKARKITLTVTVKADEKRDIANVSIQTKTVVAPAREIETKIVMDYDNTGSVVGAELKSGVKGQMFIDADGEVADDKGNKVVRFK
ncbi:replication terminator protein [Effusibacillus consociatus]|uniref:Replication terminator protein n=1 Tax=Effusibacillus consociatus TaxID=1117041 RepID=A0ABV9Q5G2_9BACL